jgi:uncharacterized protein CbrC (UPF0167 family)
MAKDILNKILNKISENILNKIPKNIPEHILENILERIPGYGFLSGMYQTLHRSIPRYIGRNLIYSNIIDHTGKYIIFSGTEEWNFTFSR